VRHSNAILRIMLGWAGLVAVGLAFFIKISPWTQMYWLFFPIIIGGFIIIIISDFFALIFELNKKSKDLAKNNKAISIIHNYSIIPIIIIIFSGISAFSVPIFAQGREQLEAAFVSCILVYILGCTVGLAARIIEVVELRKAHQ